MRANDIDPEVRECLATVLDPEVGINIVDLGLVYSASKTPDGIDVKMTLTSRACPMGTMVIEDARDSIAQRFPTVRRVNINLVWDPSWGPDFISDRAQQLLGHPAKDN
jgi:metal-sulfur cluster biosynthetic enzyme